MLLSLTGGNHAIVPSWHGCRPAPSVPFGGRYAIVSFLHTDRLFLTRHHTPALSLLRIRYSSFGGGCAFCTTIAQPPPLHPTLHLSHRWQSCVVPKAAVVYHVIFTRLPPFLFPPKKRRGGIPTTVPPLRFFSLFFFLLFYFRRPLFKDTFRGTMLRLENKWDRWYHIYI